MSVIYKTPKGTIDYYGESARKLDYMLKEIQHIFKQNGGELLDTPVFEKKDIILGKYGEEAENKLIYEIAENGGEKLVLRYDLTIPFIRFVQENNIKKCKRYSIGKVYRRDNPNASQGRFREFYQCDFDILGENNTNMISEGVILNMVCQIMSKLGITSYKIIINDTENLRKALDIVLSPILKEVQETASQKVSETVEKVSETVQEASETDEKVSKTVQGASQGAIAAAAATKDAEAADEVEVKLKKPNFKSICAAIDKLDKVSFKDIRRELASKGLTETQIDKLEALLKENGIYDENAKKRLDALYTISDIWGFKDKIEYNLSLARGLDYYNGIIFEVKLISSSSKTFTSDASLTSSTFSASNTSKNLSNSFPLVILSSPEHNKSLQTSIMAGGRYDNLVPNSSLIGFSVGITRLLPFINLDCLNIVQERKFYLTSIGTIDLAIKLKIIKWCKDNLVNDSVLRFSYDNEDKKLGKVLTEQLKTGTTDLLIIGEEELKENKIIHKDLIKNSQTLIEIMLPG